jgi:hypothetical protein
MTRASMMTLNAHDQYRLCLQRRIMDCRVEPGNDDGESVQASWKII